VQPTKSGFATHKQIVKNCQKTQAAALTGVAKVLREDGPDAFFDFEIVLQLVPFLQREESRTILWDSIERFLPKNLDVPDASAVDALTKNDLFPHLLQAGLKASRAEEAMESVLELPYIMQSRIPHKKTLHSYTTRLLMKIIHDNFKNNGIIDIPEWWSELD
jgi:hypothetical protein